MSQAALLSLTSPETLHPKLPLFWERQDALLGLLCEVTIVGTLICFCTLTIITIPAQEGETPLYVAEKHFTDTWF